ncbi:MAG: glycine-rich domain-containing protein, partial [Bacteroidota bacterium]
MKKIFTNLFNSMLHLISACFVLAIISLSNKVQAQATYNTTGSWLCPAGITSVTVQCWGAGGAGGGNPTNADGGGGGGGGAFTSKTVTVSQGNTYNFTVGAGGTGVAGGNGNSGGDTYFPTVSPQVKALGGQGGFAPVFGAGGVAGNGGASSGIGTIFHLGAIGGVGRNNGTGTGGGGGSSAGTALDGVAGSVGTATPGAGGTAPAGGGDGGNGAASNGNGNAGSIPGGGGGGSGDQNPTANRAGGNGANGQIVIVYPSITSFSPTAICTGTTPTITLTGLNLTGATAVKFNGINASSFTVVNSTTITAVPPAGVTTGYITVTIGSNIPSTITQFTVNSLPTVAITPNWCTGGGFVGLQATLGMATYLWNNGATSSFISVNQAANYSVSVTNGAGCSNSASLQVGTELVTNGNFSLGNTGFTSSYNYTNQLYSGGSTGLWIEGKYTVAANPTLYHPAFFGTDHTTGTGNFMIINGDPATGSNVWSENVTVTPNTAYYFSAWGLSIVNGNNAVLQFNVNGLQVGTVAYLPDGYVATSGPYTWVKFYGTWNSGPATSASISIVDLQTVLGGNDFGLDDISFGTLSPVSLGLAADANGNNGTCIGDPLNLNSNALGGISPFTYVWSSTTGFSSTLANPLVTASAGAGNSGTYAVTVTDVHGCTATSSTTITVSAPPTTSLTTTAANASVCSGTSTTINVSNSQSGVYYQLRNNAGNVNIGSPVAGTGVATPISLPTGNLTSTTTFNVLASNFSTDCSAQLTTTPTVTVA